MKSLLQFLFGKFSWETPAWMNDLRVTARTNPRKFWGWTAVSLMLIAGLIYTSYWYRSLPQPERVTAKITAPQLTPIDKKLVPEPLVIDFGVFINGEFNSRSVAPLDLVGKEMTDNISMSPEIKGTWLWDSDNRLIFTPETDWPADQEFTIKFNKEAFAAETRMESFKYSFNTLPFTAMITDFKFFQDPVHPAVRNAVATIQFSFPVDSASLEKNISLRWESDGEEVLFTVTYDENKRIAFLHSENIPLPKSERYLDLVLAKGIRANTGDARLAEKVKANLLVPDAKTYFKIITMNTSIVRNEQDRPEQILTVETTNGVKEADIVKGLHIYLLPQDYPATSAEAAKPNYQWQNEGEVTDTILALSKSVNLQPIPADHDYASLHSFKYHTPTPGYLYVKIDKGVKSFGDFILANNYAAILKVPVYPQEISYLHKGALLALGTEEKLSVLVRGLAAVKFNIARVLPDNVNHLITQTSGDFSNPFFINSSFNQDNISEIATLIQQFDASDPGKEQYTALDLHKYLSSRTSAGGTLGLFLLRAQGWDDKNKTALDIAANRLVLITNMGLIVKDNADDTHDIFVQAISDGNPISNASVSILGKNGVPILTRITNIYGHAAFPSLKDFINEREPTVYVVTFGNDVSFIPYYRHDRQLNYSKFDIGGVTSKKENQTALTAYIFSDRTIYRPGDTAHLGMIIKQAYVMPQPAGIPLETRIIDPRGVTVKNEKLVLADSGYLALDFTTTNTSPTGGYQVNLYIVKDNHTSSLIGSTTIHVAEFLPDTMRISAHLSQEQPAGWVSPAELSAKIGLWNLYGAPAVNHRITGRILLSPKAVTFREFPDYTFTDPLLDPKAPPKVFTDNLPETKTDDKGQAELNLKLGRFDKATYQLTVFAEGFEAEGGRSVATQTSALVSPLTSLVGYKPDGDLQYIKQDEPRSVMFIAVNPQLKQQALANLTLKLFRLHPVSTLVKKEDGTYQYQSLIQTSELAQQPFLIAQNGTKYTLPANIIGDFLITVSSADGTQLSRFKYSIVGKSAQPLPKNAELNVKLSKTEFNAGEEIEMQVTAPYTGAGLITIERDKVYAVQWFKTDATSSLQKIKIPDDFQGNGYVNIAFVRDLNSPEIFMSPLSYSVLPFSVTHKDHELQVDLAIPAEARPGEILPITYKTAKPGKIIVFAVDEGILQVAKYTTPDPLKFFFEKHALEVNTLQIVDQILPKFIAEREFSAVGGDEGERALRSNLNPFKRKTEAPVVFWSGIIDSDTMPRTLNYQIPDYFNGTLRVMAVAVSADAVGAASQSAQVRGHFVIQPNVPMFAAPGDEFEINASIANNVKGSGSNANISVQFQATSQLEILGDSKQNLVIPEGQERGVHFKVRARSQSGAANLKFIATLGNKTSAISSSLSIRPATPYTTSIVSGYSKNANVSLALNRVLYPEYRKVYAAAAASPLILITGIQRYLNDYPYGCVEQLVSKAFPWLALGSESTANRDLMNNNIQKTIQMLSQRQMSSGGFSYWPDMYNNKSNDFASVYAMHFLTEARAQGYNVPQDVYSAGIGFLKDLASQSVSSLDTARIHAYAIYILTRNEIVTSNYLTHLQLTLDENKIAWQSDIMSAYIAATYQLLKSTNEAEKIFKYYQPAAKTLTEETDFYNRYTANAQYLYLVAKHFPDRLPKLDTNLVMSLVQALNNNSMSTILSGYTSLALQAYQGNAGIQGSDISISEILNNGEKTLPLVENAAQIDLNARKVNIKNNSGSPYFYQLTETGFDKNLPEEVKNNGIEVVREYRNAEDKTLSGIKVGDEIIVHIRVRAIDNQYHDNNAIIDLLPGGFEVVRDSLASINMDYVDSREDRVIFFGSIYPDSREIIYRIKATSSGKFTVPPIYASSMYNPVVKSVGVAGEIKIGNK